MANSVINEVSVENGITYEAYRELVHELLEAGKTTGKDHSDKMLDHTRLNINRMKRLDKRVHLQADLIDELESLDRKWYWVVITEGWCGDAAQIVPILAKMAAASPQIELKIVLRDKNPDLMNTYLTEGARSIPMLICFNVEDMHELGTWGPRPEPAQKIAMDFIKNAGMPKDKKNETIQTWYNKDQALTMQEELLQSIKRWKKM